MTRAREAARLIGNNTFRLDSNNAVGFNSTTPDAMFDINRGLTVAGVSTFTGNVTMSGDLTVQGTTTTLDTIVQEVDLINIQANSSTPGLGVTQSGSGDIIAAYDGTSKVWSIADGGAVSMTANLDLADSDRIRLGASQDLQIYHDGSNSSISNDTGTFFIDQLVNDGDLNIRCDNGSGGATTYVQCDGSSGAVKLHHYGTLKFETTSSGVTVSGDVNSTSDINLKKDIEVVTSATEMLNQLRGVKFAWKENDEKSVGVIAQEVEAILPELVKGEEGDKSVNYSGLVGVLIEAVKELSARVDELENK